MNYSPFSAGRARGISATAAVVLALSQSVLPVFAQQTHYSDVPAGAYYEAAASALLDIGALDRNEARFRPSDTATRAEVAKLLVNLHDEPLLYPVPSSFNDVLRTAWYFPYIEAAAKAGWIHGDGDCYGRFRPCTARPPAPVNRAEAATLLVRAFALERMDTAPEFSDVPFNAWYADDIQTAADHCVLQGDGSGGGVRPAASMNRAEMAVMFYRAYSNMQYGEDCGASQSGISSVTALSSSRLRVTFTDDLSSVRAEDESRYDVSGAPGLDVRTATVISNRIVELELDASMLANVSYTLSVQGLATSAGTIFSDSERFIFTSMAGELTSATAISPARVRLAFNTDINRSVAEDEARYIVTRVGSGGTLGIQSATAIDLRTVELQFSSSLNGSTSYRVNVQNLLTNAGTSFSDSVTFTSLVTTNPQIIDAVATSSTKLKITFDTDLDSGRAEQTNRYVVTDGSKTLELRTANLLSDHRTVELSLVEAMQSQRSYTVNAQELITSQGISFTDNDTFIFDGGTTIMKAMLTGLQQVPLVITTATATGAFMLTATSLQYDISVQNLSGAITAAHFHLGDIGVNGPVLSTITFVGHRAVGTWMDITESQRNALLDRRIYANVHTAKWPDGEIRGQVVPQ